LDPDDQLEIVRILASDPDGLELAAEISRHVLEISTNDKTREHARAELQLSLIGAGRFAEAMQAIAASVEEALASRKIATVFNYAMADWGFNGSPNVDLLIGVVELAKYTEYMGANFAECLSLVHTLLGNKAEASGFLAEARKVLGPGHVFSCWRYLRAERREMTEDLDALERMIEGEKKLPAFIERAAKLKLAH